MKPKKKSREISVKDLKRFLKHKKIVLDCGHRFTLHPWSNTLVITAQGKTYCHNCYQ